MREIQVFIASSVREFERERLEVSPFLEMLNRIYARLDVQLKWNRPETQIGVLRMGGSQKMLDGFVESCDVFALIVGAHVGEHTEHEFGIALERFRASGGVEPVILPCFLKGKLTGELSEESKAFLTRIRKDLDIGAQYVDPIDNFDAALKCLQMVLTDFAVRVGNLGDADAEADMRRARERIADRIHSLQSDIERLQAAPTSQKTIAEITVAYAEVWRLVREYKVEPGGLLEYMVFLHKQHQYSRGIKVGHWLESFYQMETPSDEMWAMLKNRLGLCYADNQQYEQAERYYQEELEIEQRLAEKSSDYQSNVAITYNNLGNLLKDTNRMKEAETHYRKALDIQRRLAEKDSAYLPDVAMTCNNLAILLHTMNQMKEAETLFREAFEIWLRFTESNPASFAPYMAGLCDNLGGFYATLNQMEKAEERLQAALESYKLLADTNPAYLFNVAQVCYNLGLFELKKSSAESGFLEPFHCNPANRDAAKQYFKEALSLYEQFPHCANQAQVCRDKLSALSELTELQRELAKWRRD